jgi:hypothetical protein
MNVGTTAISKLVLGATDVSKAYLGTSEVWSSSVPTQLGTAFDFSVLSSSTTTIAGATSCNLQAGGAVLPSVTIGSAQHYANATSTQALSDLQAAYNYYKALTPVGDYYLGSSVTPVALSPVMSGDIVTIRFTAGVFSGAAAITNSGTITFDAEGDPNAQFIMQCGAAFTPAATSVVLLANGAKSSNIFWIVTGTPAVGAGAHIEGTIISLGALSLAAGATVNGRIMTVGTATITLSANTITTT